MANYLSDLSAGGGGGDGFLVEIVIVNFVDLRVVGLIDLVVSECIVVVALIIVAEQQTVAL